jgi:hypothetical protein
LYPEDEDGYGFAALRMPSGEVVAIVDDLGNPVPGALLWSVGSRNPESTLAEFLEVSGISSDDLSWVVGQPLEYD